MQQQALVRLRIASVSHQPAEVSAAFRELSILLGLLYDASHTKQSEIIAARAWARCMQAASRPHNKEALLAESIQELRTSAHYDPASPLPHLYRGHALLMEEAPGADDEAAICFAAAASRLARTLPLTEDEIPR